MNHLLEVKNLKVQFQNHQRTVHAVNGVSYHIDEGEIVAFVGESGSGKSVTQYSGLKLIPTPPGKIVDGEVWFEGENLLQLPPHSEKLRQIRGGKIGIVFQEPMTSLNPVLTIGDQIIEVILAHKKVSRDQAKQRAIQLLEQVGIPDAEHRINHYPHQFSGGMRQRIMIAMTMACDPKILIADEATTALDVTTQAQILELLRDIVKKTNTSLILITHNMGIVARYAERIYVMYAGTIVEWGSCEALFSNPRHPYTKGLLNAIPRLDDPKERKLIPIPGQPPNLAQPITTCPFLPRCRYKTDQCEQKQAPPLTQVGEGHFSACYNSKQLAEMDGIIPVSQSEVSAGFVEGPSTRVLQHEKGKETLLEVKQLKMYFPVTRGLLKRKVANIKAVDNVSFDIKKGETLGLVGESGCGKTSVARCILRIYTPTEGEIIFRGKNMATLSPKELQPLRRHLSLVFQDPYSSLDPRQTAGQIVGEPLKINKLYTTRAEYEDRVDQLFEMVGLNPQLKHRVPHEFSGGQRQRLGIARALASQPSLIVCDEAISALDVSIQAQIINLLEELQDELGLTYLFIAHDLSVVRHISDRVAVMYLGQIVELADWQTLYESPAHPYTQALLSAVPIPDPFVEAKREHIAIKGEVPSLLNKPSGCLFSSRCPLATDECKQERPSLREIGGGHQVACFKV